ncbi:hypothetical protein GOV08_04190 [Candidatus Woesearchaeota archaeon]|nr:hypothetical protein [Candidatus Woesearchaeota archaeon]
MAKRHKSDILVDDIIGGFKVLVVSVLVIYFAIAIINALPEVNFPIKTGSAWLVSFIGGIFFTFANYVKNINKAYGKKK